MSKHVLALFIFFFAATGCDQFCQDNPGSGFCLVLAEIEDRQDDDPVEVQCDEDCVGTYGAICVDDGNGRGVCECPEDLLEEIKLLESNNFKNLNDNGVEYLPEI